MLTISFVMHYIEIIDTLVKYAWFFCNFIVYSWNGLMIVSQTNRLFIYIYKYFEELYTVHLQAMSQIVFKKWKVQNVSSAFVRLFCIYLQSLLIKYYDQYIILKLRFKAFNWHFICFIQWFWSSNIDQSSKAFETFETFWEV